MYVSIFVYIMCSLKFSLLSIIIPKYLMLLTCSRGLLFKYTDTSVLSFLFLLVTTITFDVCTLNVILVSSAHFHILFISIFGNFSASRTFSTLTAISRSSAKAIALVRFPNSRLSNVLYWMFQNPGPQQDPCGQPLLTSFSTCMLLVLRVAVLSLK